MSCGCRKKKIKEKILLKRFVVKRQTVEVTDFKSVNIDLTGWTLSKYFHSKENLTWKRLIVQLLSEEKNVLILSGKLKFQLPQAKK